MPGEKTTLRALSENPETAEMSALWAVTVARSFLYRLREARDIVDVQIAAGAMLQDLDEQAGLGQYDETIPEADLT